MVAQTSRQQFWRGAFNGAPFILVVIPFAMLFGAVASETGLNVAEAMAMSVLVIAGAAQFTALALMEEHAPTIVVIVTALVVNLRMALYSASMSQHLGNAKLWQRALVAYLLVDQTYAASALHYDREPQATLAEKLAFFAGAAVAV
ncbi:MAG: AzlC family ABC transporter permease, partial [Pseudomonadota bacterium]